MESVPKQFEDHDHYSRIWGPILKAEEEKQEENTKKICMRSGKVTWVDSKYNLKMYFEPSDNDNWSYKNHDLPPWWRFKTGDTVEVQEEPKEWSDEESDELEYKSQRHKLKWEGHIFLIPNHRTKEFGIKLDAGIKLDREAKFKVTLVWNPEIFHRMGKALSVLRYINENKRDKKYLIDALYNRIHIKPSIYYGEPAVSFNSNIKISSPTEISLNENQLEAISMGLKNRILLVQGAAGTGKKTVMVGTTYEMLKQREKIKILMCAQSNGAVDSLAIKLHKLCIRVTRYFSRSYRLGNNRSPASDLGLIEQMFKRCPELQKDYERFFNKKTQSKRPESKNEFVDEKFERYERGQFWMKYNQVRAEVLKNTQVVCCTCVSPGGKDFERLRFDVVMIDDAAQATELECNIAIFISRATRVILAGDLKQLSPVVDSDGARIAGLGKSLFQRFIEQAKFTTIELEIQYRMHPMIAEFPCVEFYEGNITNGVEPEDRELKFAWLPAKKDKSIMFVNVESKEQKTGKSRCNKNEADFSIDLLCKIINSNGVSPDKIAVITPYEAQRHMLNKKLMIKLDKDQKLSRRIYEVEISSVNSYQGKDNDVVIATFVRANHSTSGFLEDRGKLNVALTRANCKLIIVGHYDSLKHDRTFKKLLKFIERHGSILQDWEINL